jgi:hypothetical protein
MGGPHLKLSGLHLHIGSMVNTVEPYAAAISKALEFIGELRGGGHTLDLLNIGGGYGTEYQGGEAPAPAEYAARIVPLLTGRGLKVHLEPGRSISASAGILLTRVLYVKPAAERTFAIVDAAMTDLLRPALYGAYHFGGLETAGDSVRRCGRSGVRERGLSGQGPLAAAGRARRSSGRVHRRGVRCGDEQSVQLAPAGRGGVDRWRIDASDSTA